MTEFPSTYASLETDRLLDVFEHAPARVRETLSGLDPTEMRARPAPGRWCAQEIVLHLADSEIMASARFRQALSEEGATAAVYDQDRWATALRYRDAHPLEVEAALDLFGHLRRASVRVLHIAREEEAWSRSVDHPEWGFLTLRQLLELYADHGERHIAQILAIRESLGKAIEFPLLLKERLYR